MNALTEQELAEWGRKENALRKSEMESVASAADLKRVQSACVERRRSVGISASKAAYWVLVGQRLERGESLSFALRRAGR